MEGLRRAFNKCQQDEFGRVDPLELSRILRRDGGTGRAVEAIQAFGKQKMSWSDALDQYNGGASTPPGRRYDDDTDGDSSTSVTPPDKPARSGGGRMPSSAAASISEDAAETPTEAEQPLNGHDTPNGDGGTGAARRTAEHKSSDVAGSSERYDPQPKSSKPTSPPLPQSAAPTPVPPSHSTASAAGTPPAKAPSSKMSTLALMLKKDKDAPAPHASESGNTSAGGGEATAEQQEQTAYSCGDVVDVKWMGGSKRATVMTRNRDGTYRLELDAGAVIKAVSAAALTMVEPASSPPPSGDERPGEPHGLPRGTTSASESGQRSRAQSSAHGDESKERSPGGSTSGSPARGSRNFGMLKAIFKRKEEAGTDTSREVRSVSTADSSSARPRASSADSMSSPAVDSSADETPRGRRSVSFGPRLSRSGSRLRSFLGSPRKRSADAPGGGAKQQQQSPDKADDSSTQWDEYVQQSPLASPVQQPDQQPRRRRKPDLSLTPPPASPRQVCSFRCQLQV
eukprot:TRINITY_DN5467_c0_g1_i3.p1 TRINITY_DN5467_c0_g1~~TRINITY_DN5467_c0_g1_i3.p1  ORF type:complete len:512 (+),score=123.28 TRINITY_DN5467_c0_g1_i3:179-1714(+)